MFDTSHGCIIRENLHLAVDDDPVRLVDGTVPDERPVVRHCRVSLGAGPV